jgi:hypothetical protein
MPLSPISMFILMWYICLRASWRIHFIIFTYDYLRLTKNYFSPSFPNEGFMVICPGYFGNSKIVSALYFRPGSTYYSATKLLSYKFLNHLISTNLGTIGNNLGTKSKNYSSKCTKLCKNLKLFLLCKKKCFKSPF